MSLKKFLHISSLIIGFIFIKPHCCFAEFPSWKVQQDSSKVFVVCPAKADFVSQNVKLKEAYLGVFYNDTCIGLSKIADDRFTLTFHVSKEIETSNIKLRIWNGTDECEYISVSWHNTNLPSILAPYQVNNQFYINNISFKIIESNSIYSVSDYSNENLVSTSNYKDSITFTSDDFDIKNNGDFSPNSLQNGEYLIILESDYCLDLKEIEIKITNIPNYIPPVISPYSDQEDYQFAYFNEQATSVKIYNRNGELVNSFSGPYLWNGNDSSGNPLASDEYYVQVNNNAPVATTIIR